MAAQEEEEVAEEAEEDHPDHVELEEQVENVESSRHGAQVLHNGGQTWRGEETHTRVRRRRRWRTEQMGNAGGLTQHPEEPTQQADDQQLPDLLQALLGGGQQAAVGELLEEPLAAEASHHKEKQAQPWLDENRSHTDITYFMHQNSTSNFKPQPARRVSGYPVQIKTVWIHRFTLDRGDDGVRAAKRGPLETASAMQSSDGPSGGCWEDGGDSCVREDGGFPSAQPVQRAASPCPPGVPRTLSPPQLERVPRVPAAEPASLRRQSSVFPR